LKEKKMADKDQIRKDEENLKNTPEEAEVTELDDQNLEDVSGGEFDNEDSFSTGRDVNNNCLC
jgi:hypothetical protein